MGAALNNGLVTNEPHNLPALAMNKHPMRILSLNIRHGGGNRLSKIGAFVQREAADVFLATEYRCGQRGEQLKRILQGAGYGYFYSPALTPRENSVLLASKIEAAEVEIAPPPRERRRICAIRIGDLIVVGVYFAGREQKKPLFDFLLSRPEPLRRRTILIGDFNTGLHRVDEDGATFYCAGEFEQLSRIVFKDLWRNGDRQDTREFTWLSNAGNGFRIDHALATDDIVAMVQDCSYEHATRPALTDHSALRLELNVVAPMSSTTAVSA